LPLTYPGAGIDLFVQLRCNINRVWQRGLTSKMHKLLLVEDNDMNRDMLSRRLGRQGYALILAVDGLQALELAIAEHPDLILLDMSLPEIDGWEVARRLKVSPSTALIPIIALTAHAMAGDRERCLAAGCDDYDTKPIEFLQLIGKIESLLATPVSSP
jgi:two-component system, cell cycle response regulator DivK